MLIGFICPDGKRINLELCLEKCRMKERCLTLPTLVAVSRERPWEGKASTTQLLNGTMLEFLKLTCPYYVRPQSRAFALLGTQHHKRLEEVAKELGLPAEIPLSVDRDIFDLLEQEDGYLVLSDYKTWGSYRVARALGIVKEGKGKEAVFTTDPDKADNWEAEYQLNRYRIMLRKKVGLDIHRMQLQVTVRDGGLFVAYSRGITESIYKIPIPRIPDDEIESYFDFKEQCLKEAMEKWAKDREPWKLPCNAQESWGDKRCIDYCDVAEFCPKGRLLLDRVVPDADGRQVDRVSA